MIPSRKNFDKSIYENFKMLSTLEDVAKLLEIKASTLSFILYKLDGSRDNQYRSFTIPKRTGGLRNIAAPKSPMRGIQKKLCLILMKIYFERPSAHAFLKGKNIYTNAEQHCKKNFVLNLDLENFFESINFGRVRGLFMAKPYELNKTVATILAQIACHKGALAQGAPTSPILSNMICSRLDRDLQALAKSSQCTYTRYADDLTFSTTKKIFPIELFEDSSISKSLAEKIRDNGFKINAKKTSFKNRRQRQEVTGLIVNKDPNIPRKYIRNVRAILHCWETQGIDNASSIYATKSGKKPSKQYFKRSIRGKINYIRYTQETIRKPRFTDKKHPDITCSTIWLRFHRKYHTNCLADLGMPTIYTEGSSDWMHLYRAYQTLKQSGAIKDIGIEFYKSHDNLVYGDQTLDRFCKDSRKRLFPHPVICLYDHDNKGIIDAHKTPNQTGIFLSYGHNVFSTTIPELEHNKSGLFSIEHYYCDKTLLTSVKGRRLYWSNEFDESGRHNKNSDVRCKVPAAKRHGKLFIIDSNVIDTKTGSSVALSKKAFARAILQEEIPLTKSDLDNMKKIFLKIESGIDHIRQQASCST